MEKKKITKKMDLTVIEGQGTCISDCQREYWTGNNILWNLLTNDCKKRFAVDAVYTTHF